MTGQTYTGIRDGLISLRVFETPTVNVNLLNFYEMEKIQPNSHCDNSIYLTFATIHMIRPILQYNSEVVHSWHFFIEANILVSQKGEGLQQIIYIRK